MEWTEEVTLDLIGKYRSKEILWNAKHPKYYNKEQKHDAWEELATEMLITMDECKKKIGCLQSAFRRERANIRKSKVTGTARDDLYTSSWFAFKSLLLLLDKTKVRNTQSSIATEIEEELEDDPVELRGIIQTGEIEGKEANKENRTKTTVRKRKRNNNDEKLDAAYEVLKKAVSSDQKPQEVNESQIFGNLMAKKMAKYSSYAQTAVQEAIMHILFQADRGYYNQCNSSEYGHNPLYRLPSSSLNYLQPTALNNKQTMDDSFLTPSCQYSSMTSSVHQSHKTQRTSFSSLAFPQESHYSPSSHYSTPDSDPFDSSLIHNNSISDSITNNV